MISGCAGTGKTALALDFSFHCGRPTAWYKVDAPESELKIFFQYLIASIQKQRAGFGTETLAPLVSVAEPAHIPLLAEAFVYELAEGDNSPLLIVIEDLHLVCDAEWLVPFFRRLLPLLPSEVHMLITSQGSYEPWVEEQRTYYPEQYLRLLEALAGVAQKAEDWPRSVQLAKRILQEDQFREDIHCLIMRAHAALGNRGAVKEQYEGLSQILRHELGVDPCKETKNSIKNWLNRRSP